MKIPPATWIAIGYILACLCATIGNGGEVNIGPLLPLGLVSNLLRKKSMVATAKLA